MTKLKSMANLMLEREVGVVKRNKKWLVRVATLRGVKTVGWKLTKKEALELYYEKINC